MLRLIDANLDRLGEGLRVLEDVARFLLDDASLSEQLKNLRHELLSGSYTLQQQLLASRKAQEDVGAFLEVPTEGQRQDITALVMANARRVQESLRVLEEFAKLPTAPVAMDWAKFKQARFTLYEIEQRLVFKLLRQDKVNRLAGLYLILDTEALQGHSEVEIARRAIRGGVRVLQLRDKRRNKRELLKIAQDLKRVCAEEGVLFIINDYLDLAIAADADGLHLGQKDLPLIMARQMLPQDKILGCSAANLSEALQGKAEGADYIAVGSIYPTSSKADARLAGLETLRQVRQTIELPLVAIGGINQANITEVIKAGAVGAAVINAVLGAEDIEQAARQLAEKFDKGGKVDS